MLNEERIPFESISVYSTPRRLVLLVEGFSERQENLEGLVKGPSKKIAFDSEGNPTKALQGFLKGQSSTIEDIFTQEYNGEKYIYLNKVKEGKLVEDILKENMDDMIKSITFPKSMRWGGKNLRFARPIRWLLSILNDKVVEFSLEGIIASNITRGHRFLGSSHIEIGHVDEYIDKLQDNYVIVDGKKRKEKIKYGCEKLAREKGGTLLADEALLDEITNIVEYPTPMIGRIEEEYLKLPKEVVTTPMKEHQRYFPVVDDKKRLLPYFITVRNGNDEYLDMVIKGKDRKSVV